MDYRKILEANDVELFFFEKPPEMEKSGIYLPEARVIFVDKNLDEIDRENVIYHECGHLFKKHEFIDGRSPTSNIRMEMEADKFTIIHWIEKFLEEYDETPEYINIHQFMENFHLNKNYYDIAEQEFYRILAEKAV